MKGHLTQLLPTFNKHNITNITARFQRQNMSNYELISNPHASPHKLCVQRGDLCKIYITTTHTVSHKDAEPFNK